MSLTCVTRATSLRPAENPGKATRNMFPFLFMPALDSRLFLQTALDDAQPGDVIILGDGEYFEDPVSKVRIVSTALFQVQKVGGSSRRTERYLLRS